MTDRDIIARVAAMWNVKVHNTRLRQPHYKPVYRAIVKGYPAVDVMTRIAPLMGERRRLQIELAIEGYATKARRLRPSERAEIVAALHAGERAPDIAHRYRIAREHVYRLARQAA